MTKEKLQEELDELRRKIELYSLGDRPSSPPVWMLEKEDELVRRLAGLAITDSRG